MHENSALLRIACIKRIFDEHRACDAHSHDAYFRLSREFEDDKKPGSKGTGLSLSPQSEPADCAVAPRPAPSGHQHVFNSKILLMRLL
jgi:hypothetical protein